MGFLDGLEKVGRTVMKNGAANMKHQTYEFERKHGDKLTNEQKEELRAKRDSYNEMYEKFK